MPEAPPARRVPGRRLRRGVVPLATLAVLALAAWVRLGSYPQVLAGGELLAQVDGDSSYHLRRTLAAVRSFPRVERFDPQMNWPRGAFVPWADGFDLGAAAFARAVGGAGHAGRAGLAVALFPVALGIVLVWATILLARVVAPGRRWCAVAAMAGLAAALLPDGVASSRLGRVDHHVFEALVVVLLSSWSLRALRPGRGPWTPAAPLRFEAEGALLVALALYGFTGSPLYVAVALAPLAWAAFTAGRMLGSGGPGLAAGGALAALLSLPALVEHGQVLTFKLPSLLQPLLVIAAGGALLVVAWWGSAAPGQRRRRVLATAGGLALGAPLAALAAGSAWSALHEAVVGWLLRRDAWLATVGEFEPLLGVGSPLVRVHALFGWAGFALPPAVIGLAASRRLRSPRMVAFLGTVTVYAALTLLQNRFSRVLVPLAAVTLALALGMALRALATPRRWRGAAWSGMALLAAAFLADPASRALLSPESPPARPDAHVEAALDLRDAPPPPSLAPGVLAHWASGHHVQRLAGAPVVTNGFGAYLDREAYWKTISIFGGSAAELDAYLAEREVGILLAGVASIGPQLTGVTRQTAFVEGRLNRQHMEAFPLSPLLMAGSSIPAWNVRHLPHLMPRFASSATVAQAAFPLPFIWAYERVAGARVVGEAPPGARVIGELAFTERGRPHTYKAFADAGPDGRWELVLPLPGGLVLPTLRTEERWRLAAAGGPPVELEVPEQAVRQGATLVAGALVAGAAGLPEGEIVRRCSPGPALARSTIGPAMTSLSVLVPVYNEAAPGGGLAGAALGAGGEPFPLHGSRWWWWTTARATGPPPRWSASQASGARLARPSAARRAAPGPGPAPRLEWRFLRHERNGGKGKAIQTALAHADGEITIIHDADLEYHPRDILRIVKVFVEEAADAVFGSRFAGGEARRALLFRHELGQPAPDLPHQPGHQPEPHRHGDLLQGRPHRPPPVHPARLERLPAGARAHHQARQAGGPHLRGAHQLLGAHLPGGEEDRLARRREGARRHRRASPLSDDIYAEDEHGSADPGPAGARAALQRLDGRHHPALLRRPRPRDRQRHRQPHPAASSPASATWRAT